MSGVGRLGVCSWSMRAETPRDLADMVFQSGLEAVQIALDPIREGTWGMGETQRTLDHRGIAIASGMMRMAGEDYSSIASIERTGGVRSDEHWEENLAHAREHAAIAEQMGINLVTFHAGFLPRDTDAPLRQVMVERLKALTGLFLDRSVRVGFETGQEDPHTLMEVLDAIGDTHVGVNFDPANMILYGSGDPVDSLAVLGPRVMQMHAKDAKASKAKGEWGTEMPVGEGDVAWDELFAVVERADMRCDVIIEREVGDDPAGDVRASAEFLRGLGVGAG